MIGFMPPMATIAAKHRNGREADRIELGPAKPDRMASQYIGKHRREYVAVEDVPTTPAGFIPSRRTA